MKSVRRNCTRKTNDANVQSERGRRIREKRKQSGEPGSRIRLESHQHGARCAGVSCTDQINKNLSVHVTYMIVWGNMKQYVDSAINSFT